MHRPELTQLRVWVDDDLIHRAAPEGWLQVTTAAAAIRLLATDRVVELSLDHDLGDDERAGRGVDVIDYLVAEQEVYGRSLWPRDGITLHTANPYRCDAMALAIRVYAPRFRAVDEELTAGGERRFRFSAGEAWGSDRRVRSTQPPATHAAWRR